MEGQSWKVYFISHDKLLVYRPHDHVVCDRKDFGGKRRRVMALMKLYRSLDEVENVDPDEGEVIAASVKESMTWTLQRVGSSPNRFYILSHKGEPLYRPADHIVCDKKDFGGKSCRLMALVRKGQKLSDADVDLEKITWTLQLVPGSSDKFHILSHLGEPLYRPADNVVCDKHDFGGEEERLMLLMKKGTTVASFAGDSAPKIEWTFKMLEGTAESIIKPLLTPRDCSVPEGKRAVWEWCTRVNVKQEAAKKLPDSDWVAYTPDQNNSVELAYSEGYPNTPLDVGARQYTMFFATAGQHYSKQRDVQFDKVRLARRCVKAEEDSDERVKRRRRMLCDQDTCVLCFEKFEDTPSMPFCKLSDCPHVFHKCCILPIREAGDPCPLCKTPVKWKKVPK
jgi:hypothetical protein